MYHGTERKRGERIQEVEKMEVSRGAHHWLGDGSYFYEEDLYAYRWIEKMHRSRCTETEIQYINIINQYMILEADYDVNENRIFSFSKVSHKQIFDAVANELKKKVEFSKKIDNVADGTILNFMFNKLGYEQKFDMVIATFNHAYKSNTYKDYTSRLMYLPEVQICVKNIDVIKNIREYDISDNEEKYFRFSNLYNIDYTGVINNKGAYKFKSNNSKYRK